MNIAPPRVSVIIPTYNESANIPILLKNLAATLESTSHEIIVVDDNSPDRTWEIVEKISKENPSIKVIRRLKERGLSSAVITGMEVAQGETLAVMDADLQHDESILPAMVRTIVEEGYDVCIGSRGSDGGSYGDWSRGRRFVSWVAATMARIVLPREIKDPMSGFFVISRDLYRRSADRINPRGFKILLEFIGRNKNLKVREVGYTFRNRIHGETKLSGSVIRNYIIALYDLKFGEYISPTFMLYAFVGTTGVAVNLLAFGLGEALRFPHIRTGLSAHFDPLFLSVPFGIQVSIVTNYILNNYITFYEDRHRGWNSIRGFVTFEAISLFGLVVQLGVFQLLHNNGFLSGLVADAIRKFINNGIGIVVATVSNYYLNVSITWKKVQI